MDRIQGIDNMKRILSIALIAMVAIITSEAYAQKMVRDTIGVRIFFRQSKVELLPNFKGNEARLDSL